MVPSAEERKLIRTYVGSARDLAKAEQFFHSLLSFTDVQHVLECFVYMLEFDTQMSDMLESLNCVLLACEEGRSPLLLSSSLSLFVDPMTNA
jgi:hypothetical protein